MKKILSGGLVIFAGVVSLPLAMSPSMVQRTPSHDYRTDPRLSKIRHFFEKFDCPAWKYSAAFLEVADDYELDWRLLPSISFVESTGGKSAPHNNLFGWDSGNAQFVSPTAGIHQVGYKLSCSRRYRDKELDDVLETYNPNAEYAAKVKSVMRRIAPTE